MYGLEKAADNNGKSGLITEFGCAKGRFGNMRLAYEGWQRTSAHSRSLRIF
eukprot:SAG31_NODE_9698_length_1240_cov_1.474145_3_plen_50_part_01